MACALTCATQTHPLQSSLAGLHVAQARWQPCAWACVYTFTRTQMYTLWRVHTETHTQAHAKASAKCTCTLVYADAVGQSACLRTLRCHPAQHSPRASLSQAWSQHQTSSSQQAQPLGPGPGCSAQATFQMPQIQADSDSGDPCFLPPVPPELNLEPWGLGLQERTPLRVPWPL